MEHGQKRRSGTQNWRIVISTDHPAFDNGGCRGGIYRIYREIGAKNFGAVSKAPARQQSLWRRSVIFAVEDKCAGRYPANFCVVAIADASVDY